MIKTLFFPMLYLLTIYIFLLKEEWFTKNLCNIIPFYTNIPAHPPIPMSNVMEALKCGELINAFKNSQDVKIQEKILKEMTELLDWYKPITANEISEMETNLKTYLENKSWSKVLGFLSFVNILWFLSIFGIIISLFFLFHNLIIYLVQYVLLAIYPLRHYFFKMLIPVFYLISFLFIVQGKRFGNKTKIRLMFSTTGILLSVLCFFYNRLAMFNFNPPPVRNPTLSTVFIISYNILILVPLTFQFDSELFGFVAVTLLFNLLGFSVLPLGLCWLIGWRSEDKMDQSINVALILLLANVLCHFTGFIHLIKNFRLGLNVMGSLVFFLGMMIKCSKYVYYYGKINQYFFFNFQFVLFMIFFLFSSSVLNMHSLFNTSCVFLVLYVVEKYEELINTFFFNGAFIWMYLFVIFVSIWFLCYYISAHAYMLTKMFSD